MFVHSLTGRAAAGVALCLLALPLATGSAQTLAERLEMHGSLNAAYGRATDLPVFGIPTKGTSDYRVFTLQSRFKLDENDQIVTQFFNRRLGTSPMASAISDVTMQWAYWQHRSGDFTYKVGRNPLPRGLYNETRYIGTVHAFFRPPNELQQEAFDAIDGAVVSYRARLPLGMDFEQHAFAGGSENRAIASTTTGQEVRIARTENMFGGQSYLHIPLASMRLGAYGARYNFNQTATKGYRTNVIWSGEATISRLKLQTEHGRITGYLPNNDNRSGYVLASVRLHDRLSVGGQQAYTNRMLFFTDPSLNRMIREVRTEGAVVDIALPGNAVLKFEQHWRRGWQFDTPTPPVASQTATSVTLSPMRHSRYFLASIAASF